MISRISFIRQLAGVLIKDAFRYLSAIYSSGGKWLALCNRYETLESAPEGRGFKCDWQFTSMLHAPTIIPWLGKRLLLKVVLEHFFYFANERGDGDPAVSVIIGHRGVERLPHLLLVLKSIAAQEDVNLECIVVEQSYQKEVASQLPSWVRYIHTPVEDADIPYNRSWAFNSGAEIAKGTLLILHDNDIIVPRSYIREHLKIMEQGYEVVNLKRFIFYLSESHSKRIFDAGRLIMDEAPKWIMQNATGGGSIAITRGSYLEIGGFDAEFVGWGGEDNEFWERANTLKVWPYAYLPIIHLWHPPQKEKNCGEISASKKRYWELQSIPPKHRIKAMQEQIKLSEEHERAGKR